MSILRFDDLPSIREKYKDKKMVFCTGTFDLTHAGHVLFFEDCKKLGDVLIVGVGNDHNLKHYKKRDPIVNEHLRLKLISSLKPVDHCFLQLPVPPGEIIELLQQEFKALKPDIYVVNEDAFNIPRRSEITEHFGIPMIILKRWTPSEFEDISTTKIIEQIKGL